MVVDNCMIGNLSQLTIGGRARVKAVDTVSSVNQRLMTLGLLPGMEIQVVQVAPLGDPIAVRFAGQQISLRRAEAAQIVVEPI